MYFLSAVAQKYLCICTTSAPSERVFSVGGNVVASKKSALKPQKVNELIFLGNDF